MTTALLTQTQSQALDLFEAGKYRELLKLLAEAPGSFPQKQFPVGVCILHCEPGVFGYRTSPTTFAAVNKDGSFITFTVSLEEVTLNLHAKDVACVKWCNGTISQQWVYSQPIDRKNADLLVRHALQVLK